MDTGECITWLANDRDCSEYDIFMDAYEAWRGARDQDIVEAAFNHWFAGRRPAPGFVERYVIRHCPGHDDRTLGA
jgi:hypothetical protein